MIDNSWCVYWESFLGNIRPRNPRLIAKLAKADETLLRPERAIEEEL